MWFEYDDALTSMRGSGPTTPSDIYIFCGAIIIIVA